MALYNKVPLCDFFGRLNNGSGSLEATDIVYLLSAMLVWSSNNPRIPEYVNRPEDAKKKSVQENLPIYDM